MSADFGIRYDVTESLEHVRQTFDGLSICEIKAENINALLEQKISEKVLSDCLLFANSQPQDTKTRYFKKNAELPRTLVMTEHCFYVLLKGKDKQLSHENWTTRRTVAIRIHKDAKISLVYQFVNLDSAPSLSDAELTLRKAKVLDTYDYIKEKDGKTYTKTTAFVKQCATSTLLDPSRDNEEYTIHEFDNKSRLYLEKSVTFSYNAGSLLEQYVARNDQRSVLFLRGKSTIDERRDAIVTAAKGGNVDMLKLLVRRGDSAQYLAEAFRCSIRGDHIPAAKFLLNYGCAETLYLFESINSNSTIEMMAILLEHVEHTEENITHALVKSLMEQKPEFIDLILKMKRKDVPIGPRALAAAVFCNSLESVQALSNHPDTSQNRFGCAIVAACEQDNGMLELLFSLDAKRDLGYACKEAAAVCANLDLVQKVCNLGTIAQEDLVQAYRATPSSIKHVRGYLLSLIDIEEYNEQCLAKIFDATERCQDDEAADLAAQLLP
ncbi:MAG: hypothetical protein LLF94_09800 [Chlamydiales bacterium]|nr:hypothetical protein [Chlamydiales bacterium]